MNNAIKSKIEGIVMDDLDMMKKLDPIDKTTSAVRKGLAQNINTLVEILQREDVNNDNSLMNSEKIKNDIEKIKKEHEINLKKIYIEEKKNEDNLYLGKEKINYDYDKMKTDVEKGKQEYDINKEKIQIELEKNKNNLYIENRKIDHVSYKDKEDIQIKKNELKMNVIRDVGMDSDRIIKMFIDSAAIIIPAVCYNIWMNKGFKFEETGSYTSNTFKNLLGKLKPTK